MTATTKKTITTAEAVARATTTTEDDSSRSCGNSADDDTTYIDDASNANDSAVCQQEVYINLLKNPGSRKLVEIFAEASAEVFCTFMNSENDGADNDEDDACECVDDNYCDGDEA